MAKKITNQELLSKLNNQGQRLGRVETSLDKVVEWMNKVQIIENYKESHPIKNGNGTINWGRIIEKAIVAISILFSAIYLAIQFLTTKQ